MPFSFNKIWILNIQEWLVTTPTMAEKNTRIVRQKSVVFRNRQNFGCTQIDRKQFCERRKIKHEHINLPLKIAIFVMVLVTLNTAYRQGK